MRFFNLLLSGLGVVLLLPLAARAQQAGDTTTAVCGPPRTAMQCVDFDATRSVDPGAGELTYRWHMGDGTTLTGPKISYCYKERKDYVVQLDVLVNATGELRKAEKLFPVTLTRQEILDFKVLPALTAKPGEILVFEAPEAQLPACQNVVLLWDFRDGAISNGRRVEHSFRQPGTYHVRLSLRGNGPGSCPDSHCVTRTVVVK